MADLRLAIKLEADGTALVGGVRLSRDELRKLGEEAKQAANALGGLGDNVVPFSDAQRQQLRGLMDTLHPAAARARDLQQSLALLRQAEQAGEVTTRQHAAAVAELHRQHRAANDSAGTLGTSIVGLATSFRGLAGIVAGGIVVRFTQEALAAGSGAERLDRRLKSLAGTSVEVANAQAWLATESDRLAMLLPDLADRYGRLLVLQQAGLVTTQQARDLTVGLRDAQEHFAVSADRMNDVMYGMAQALSSPIVHMEELSQVVEPLPGLLLDMDKAANLPAGGFRRLVNDGKVTAEMFRDTLLKALKGYAGEAEKAAKGYEGAVTRAMEARRRFFENAGKTLLPSATAAENLQAGFWDWAGRALTGATEGSFDRVRGQQRTRLALLLRDREQALTDIERYKGGAGGTWSGRNLSDAQARLSGAQAGIDDTIRRLDLLDQRLATNTDGWAEMWGVAEEGAAPVRTAADSVRGGLEAAFEAGGLAIDKMGDSYRLLTKDQKELFTHLENLAKVAALPPEELRKLGVTAGDVALMMDHLRSSLDPIPALLKELRDETAALQLPEGFRRDLYQLLDKAQAKKGRPLSDQEVIDVTDAAKENRDAKADNRVEQMRQEREATERLATARASGSQAAVVAAQADNAYWAEFRRSRSDAKAREAWTETYKKGMADLAGTTGEATSATSRQARQALELADAYAKGGAAVAEVELRHRIENETLKSGAGAHSALAKAITEEEKAKRKLMAAQYDRDLEMQIKAALALAAAERDGAKALADVQIANAAAIQIEREGVAVDSERAKSIRAKLDELAKWNEAQGYAREGRQADQQIQLARLELSLQGENEQVRQRTLELARYELEIREKYPRQTEEEIQALLKKRAVLIEIQGEVERQGGAWREIAGTLEKAFERLGDAAVEAFFEGKKSAVDFGNVSRAVIASVVTDLIKMGAIRPLQNALFNQNQPTLWDAFSGGASNQNGAQGQGGGSGSAATNLGSLGSSVYSAATGTNALGTAASNFAYSSYGSALGLSSSTVLGTGAGGTGAFAGSVANASANTLTSTGSAFTGAAGSIGYAMPYGAIGGMGGAYLANNYMNGNRFAAAGTGAALGVGSMAAGTAMMGGYAALAAIPVYGWIAAAVLAAITAVFGASGKPSTNYGGAYMELMPDGATGRKGSGAAESMSEQLAAIEGNNNNAVSVLGEIVKAGDLKLSNSLIIASATEKGQWTNKLGGFRGPVVSTSQDPTEVALAALRYLAGRDVADDAGPTVKGNSDVLTALRYTKSTKPEDVISDMGFARTFRDSYYTMLEGINPVKGQEASIKAAAEENSKVWVDFVKTFRQKSVDLNLATKGEATGALTAFMDTVLGLREARQPLSDLQMEYRTQIAVFGSLRDTLIEVSGSAEYADKKLTEAQDKYKAQVAGQFNASLDEAINAATGRGYINDAAAAYRAYEANVATSREISGDMSRVSTLWVATMQSIVDQSQLTGAAFDELISRYPELRGQVHAFTEAVSDAADVITDLTDARRRAQWRLAGHLDPAFTMGPRASLHSAGIDPDKFPVLTRELASFLDLARIGAATTADLTAMYGQLSARTRLSAEQYAAALDVVDAAWERSTAMAATRASVAWRLASAANDNLMPGPNRILRAAGIDPAAFPVLVTELGQFTSLARAGAATLDDLSAAYASVSARAASSRLSATQYAEALDQLDSVWQAQAQAVRQTADAMRGAAKSLRDAAAGMRTDDTSSSGGGEKLKDARERYETLLGKARAGDAQAMQDVIGAGQRYRELAKAWTPDQVEYRRIDTGVIADLEALAGTAETRASAEERLLGASTRQVELLEDVVEALRGTSWRAPASAGGVNAQWDTVALDKSLPGKDGSTFTHAQRIAVMLGVGYTGEVTGGAFAAWLDAEAWRRPAANAVAKRLFGLSPFAEGGIVRGGVAGRDSVPAMLMPDEAVLTTFATRRLGTGTIAALNSGAPVLDLAPVVLGLAETSRVIVSSGATVVRAIERQTEILLEGLGQVEDRIAELAVEQSYQRRQLDMLSMRREAA